jgi:hypothetical protein
MDLVKNEQNKGFSSALLQSQPSLGVGKVSRIGLILKEVAV